MKIMHWTRPRTASAVCVAALALFGGCATTGSASGRVTDRDGDVVPARIGWSTPSPYGTHGRMVVTLPDGSGYIGDYRLVGTPDAMTLSLFEPWRVGWPDWPLPWEGAALPPDVAVSDDGALLERYRGLAIASLESPSGEHLRCRFGLLQPTIGLAGGVDGDCQVMPSQRAVQEARLAGFMDGGSRRPPP